MFVTAAVENPGGLNEAQPGSRERVFTEVLLKSDEVLFRSSSPPRSLTHCSIVA